jgi:uncharacterized membrane protein YhaH (DUF805 family)
MKHCSNCKAELVVNHAFCPTCGFDLRLSNGTSQSQQNTSSPEMSPPPIPSELLSSQDALVNQVIKPKMFHNVFNSNGRIRRLEYVISMIIGYFSLILFQYIFSSILQSGKIGDVLSIIISIIFYPLWLIFIITQGTKRCHDLGKDGFYQFIPFYFFWLLFSEGEHTQNQYGNNPKVY